MTFNKPYHKRPIRFLEIHQEGNWAVKLYSISYRNRLVSQYDIQLAKEQLAAWLQKATAYQLPTYNIATLILHEFDEGCFAIVNWWIDENMLQNVVFLKRIEESEFKLYSQDGMATCVWEMAVWWHERNAWVEHVLLKKEHPDFDSYLQAQLNQDV